MRSFWWEDKTRMPLVRRFVSELFGCVEFEETRGDIRLGAEFHRPQGPRLNTSTNPEEAVALGAAIQAEILAGGLRNHVVARCRAAVAWH